MHAIEKIIAKHSGKDYVNTGEIVTVNVDFAEINDLYLQTVYSFYEMGGDKVWDKNKVAFVFDHFAPCPTIKSAQNHIEMREFARKNDLTYHFDVNKGVCHQVMPEAGIIHPGMILFATDSHTTTHGAFGALGTGCGATDMACILIEGQTWVRVPEIMEIKLEGATKKAVFAKDVILYVLGKIKADGAVYKAIDFSGSYIDSLGVADRMTICNMAVEMGAKTAYMQPNQLVLDYVKEKSGLEYTPEFTDPDYTYTESYTFDVSNLDPQISLPGNVDDVCPVDRIADQKIEIDQAYIGSCTNGRVEDFKIAAEILRGKKIPKYKRLMLVPASKEVLDECIKQGYVKDLLDAGGVLVSPGCAACLGVHAGIIGAHEKCITSTNRNFRGRMGSNEASLYLASPATVAASILNGYITDPTEYIRG